MTTPILGLHHMTAIISAGQPNIDFYAGLLGLRLVKLTVDFDAPTIYHFYFGDDMGRPGTLVTFFPMLRYQQGQPGSGQISATALAVPPGSLVYWRERLAAHGVTLKADKTRFGQPVIAFGDPDGLVIELVEQADAATRTAWQQVDVPLEYAVRGLAYVTLTEAELAPTAATLTEALGFRFVGNEGNRHRYEVAEGGSGKRVDVLVQPGLAQGEVGIGSVHHIAYRIADDDQQLELRFDLAARGYQVTTVRDRKYFHSIYFHEPGNVLFEVATDVPGFAVDESPEELGTHLMLPPQFEPRRAELERILPPLRLPQQR